MKIGSAEFLTSATNIDESPEVDLPEIVIVGRSNVGKSTLLKTLMGLTPAEYGTINFLGTFIQDLDSDIITRMGISLVPEGRLLFSELTVRENLVMGAYILKEKKTVQQNIDKVLELFPVLKGYLQQKAGLLSGGEQQMLVIARALMSEPKLLLLDEPSLGLSPLLVSEIFELIREIHQKGMAIILVEQNMSHALKVADYAYIMENGRMRLSGNPEQIMADEDVKEFYFGHGKGKYVSREDRWKGSM